MEIKILLQNFKRFIDQRKPKEAKDFSENIGKYFERNHLTDSEIGKKNIKFCCSHL
jgi:hypothetical protein